jgi:hypothetical protein
MHCITTIPVYAPYPCVVARYPINYRGSYEPPAWERYEEQFHPPWLRKLERQMGIRPGREPLWWELFEEQFEPPWLQHLERRMGIPQPFNPLYDLPR